MLTCFLGYWQVTQIQYLHHINIARNKPSKEIIYLYIFVVIKIVNWSINGQYVNLGAGCLSVEFIWATESMIIRGCGCMKSQNRFFPCRSILVGSYLAVLGSHLFSNVSLSLKKLFILYIADLLSQLSLLRILSANKLCKFNIKRESMLDMYNYCPQKANGRNTFLVRPTS